jgi:hypothetical protein
MELDVKKCSIQPENMHDGLWLWSLPETNEYEAYYFD